MPFEAVVKFISDENLDSLISNAVGKQFDIVEVAKSMPGASDEAVLSRAARENRILITQDKDFGQLAFFQLQRHSGVILLRAPNLTDHEKADLVLRCIEHHGAILSGSFVVLEPDRIRIRPATREN